MTSTHIPAAFADLVPAMAADHRRLLAALAAAGLATAEYPARLQGRPRGVAAARAYPIQGILKYHGIADWHWRTAYLPSISVCNDAAYTLTLVEFEPNLDDDEVYIGGQPAVGRERDRVQRPLDAVRGLCHLDSPARVTSRNVTRASKTGKGLGTSASASAALAMAALAAACGPEAVQNTRLLTCLARLLAGSGGRSAAGGVSLWLSYPGIPHEESYSVCRLDHAGQMDDLAPVDGALGITPGPAHRDRPRRGAAQFLLPPLDAKRTEEVLDCLAAVRHGDWRTVGQWAELDSNRLHGVTMSGSPENKLFAWEPRISPCSGCATNYAQTGCPSTLAPIIRPHHCLSH
jgi:diphosphomevalonate decarboxylase